MAFSEFKAQQQVVDLLQRSLGSGRLAHAYLFTGDHLEEMEAAARTLTKTLNCTQPPATSETGLPVDCCDHCLSCHKVDNGNHPDIQWIRPESKLRFISVDQIRDLMQTAHLKPTEARFKVFVIVEADRLKTEASNAFLKTLEEPPPNSIIILLSTDPRRILETILSRCMRLSFAGAAGMKLDDDVAAWLGKFSTTASNESKSLLGRYRLLGTLTRQLGEIKTGIDKSLSDRSAATQYEDADPSIKNRWETELTAAIEAEYRRQRLKLLGIVEWWLRDVWLKTLGSSDEMLAFPALATASGTVASRLKPEQAMENLSVIEDIQRRLHTNAQESLVLEVGLLKLKL